MKDKLIQILTLLLCFILLAVAISQNRRLEAYRCEMEQQYNQLQSEIRDISSQVGFQLRQELESAAQPISSFEVDYRSINTGSRTLETEVTLTLKQWSKDTAVTLTARFDDSQVTSETVHEGAGFFSAPLSIPMEGTDSITLTATVTTGGVNTQQELAVYSDFESMVPLGFSGCSWSAPDYSQGSLNTDFDITLEWREDWSGTVELAQFEIYVNNELTQTVPVQEFSNDALHFSLSRWGIPCGENDTVHVTLRCEDSYGIGYVFSGPRITLEDGRPTDQGAVESAQFYWLEE